MDYRDGHSIGNSFYYIVTVVTRRVMFKVLHRQIVLVSEIFLVFSAQPVKHTGMIVSGTVAFAMVVPVVGRMVGVH